MRRSTFVFNERRLFRRQFRILKTRRGRVFYNVQLKYRRLYHNIRGCRAYTSNMFTSRQFIRTTKNSLLVHLLRFPLDRFANVVQYTWYLVRLLLFCTFHNLYKYGFEYYKFIQTRWAPKIALRTINMNRHEKHVVYTNRKLPHVFWHLLFRNIFFMAFVNSLIRNGKKEKVELLLFKLLCSLKHKTRKQPVFFINNLFQTLQPVVETFPFTVSGRSYPVPKVVLNNKRLTFLVRIIKMITNRQRKRFNFNVRFLRELILASSRTGLVYSTILDMHRFSFDNRINMRFIRRRRKKRRVFI